ncbi:MAG: hypothetical protein K6T61_10335 [Bryobacteraceae bacterium]|nr:hypothetical protein [Bryobacteraceae bacterium]
MEQLGPSRWYAVETKTRLEPTVESLLRNKGYETFLPLYKVRRQWSDRIKLLDAALFPGYLFSRLGGGQRTLPLLTTPFVRGIVSSGGRPLPVPEEEVEAVRAIVASGLPATPWPYLQEGDRVRIRHGSLAVRRRIAALLTEAAPPGGVGGTAAALGRRGNRYCVGRTRGPSHAPSVLSSRDSACR